MNKIPLDLIRFTAEIFSLQYEMFFVPGTTNKHCLLGLKEHKLQSVFISMLDLYLPVYHQP